jgi:hypothetical protein
MAFINFFVNCCFELILLRWLSVVFSESRLTKNVTTYQFGGCNHLPLVEKAMMLKFPLFEMYIYLFITFTE